MISLKQINTERVLLAIVVWCVYSFKVLLFGVGEAGLRPDDLLILFASAMLLVNGTIFNARLSKAFKLYALFVGVGLVSSLWNGRVGRVNLLYSVLFDVRLVEYMMFYYIGFYLARRGHGIHKIMLTYFWLMLIVVPLQMAHIVPVASAFGWQRAVGNTNGPYEFAAVASFLLCYLGYRRRSFLTGLGAVVLVVLSASRVTFVGVVVSLYSYMFRLGKRNLQATVLTGAALFLSLGAAVFLTTNSSALADSDISLLSRLGSAEQGSSVSSLIELYPNAPVYENTQDYIQGTFDHSCDFGNCSDGQTDVSATIREYRWTALVKSTLASFDSIIIGLGPSFGSTAVDGYFVRIFSEEGILGLTAFLISMVGFWDGPSDRFWAFREYVIVLLVSASFIDIFTSYKAMILLWLWHGLNEGELAAEAESEPGASQAANLTLAGVQA